MRLKALLSGGDAVLIRYYLVHAIVQFGLDAAHSQPFWYRDGVLAADGCACTHVHSMHFGGRQPGPSPCNPIVANAVAGRNII